MADEKKSDTSKKEKPAAKPAAKAVEAKPAKAAKAAKAPREKTARSKATPAVAADAPACRIEKCRQPLRAKGLCQKHYLAWRRGEVGDHHRYKTCSKEACRKPRAKGGLCEEHAGIAAPAAEGAAPA